MKEKIFTTKKITVAAVMTAISYILYMFVKFPLPIFPSWLDVQISELPAMLTGFMAGPLWGSAVILFKCLLKLPFSTTACVGELGDLLMGIAYVLPASLLYYRNRTKKTAVIALIVGSMCEVAVGILVNSLILVPFYAKAFGWSAIIGMLTKLFPKVTEKSFYLYYLPLSVLPFNLLRMLICSLITFFVYKHLHRLINKMFVPKTKFVEVNTDSIVGTEAQDKPESQDGSDGTRSEESAAALIESIENTDGTETTDEKQ